MSDKEDKLVEKGWRTTCRIYIFESLLLLLFHFNDYLQLNLPGRSQSEQIKTPAKLTFNIPDFDNALATASYSTMLQPFTFLACSILVGNKFDLFEKKKGKRNYSRRFARKK